MIGQDIEHLSPLINQSFITAVSETKAESQVPFPTEKICFPIANKALWLAYAQTNYYQFIEQYLGFKKYTGINYDFDNIKDPIKRLQYYMKELQRLSGLTNTQKQDLYSVNREIIEHNFYLLTSGQVIANIWEHSEANTYYEKFMDNQLTIYRSYDLGQSFVKPGLDHINELRNALSKQKNLITNILNIKN